MPDPSLVPLGCSERGILTLRGCNELNRPPTGWLGCSERGILTLRGQRVILDADLAAMYGVETKVLVRAVKRNKDRFPPDFMFPLSPDEFERLRFHSGTSSSWGGCRYLPYAFSEQGVAMLSSVLRSARAVQVNIEIMRAFVRLRRMVASSAELARRLHDLEQKYDAQLKRVFDAIRALMAPPAKARRRIGFGVEEGRPSYGVFLARVGMIRSARPHDPGSGTCSLFS